jgi:hypothetical protein
MDQDNFPGPGDPRAKSKQTSNYNSRSLYNISSLGASSQATGLVGPVFSERVLARARSHHNTLRLAIECSCVDPRGVTHRSPDSSASVQDPETSSGRTSARTQQYRDNPSLTPTEERIKYLHDRFRITPTQEPLWAGVARVMRDNANAVAPLI